MNDSTLKSHKSKKVASLYEIDYYEEGEIQPTELPLVNPYLAYQKSSFSPLKSIKSLIHTPSKTVKEYVQSSRFDSCPITGSAQEQWVTLEIPAEFPRRWIETGYSHIHFGAIRLSLNYHGVEGKPVVARIALLDTRYLKYEDACIATVEATMNNGLIMVTLFPNFTMALADPNLMEALKVQIHIVGAPQVADSIIATLHYQFAYRIQDHAFKLTGCGTGNSLFLSVHTKEEPHCTHIPRQIPRKDLIKLLPDRWVTNYEKLHEGRQPIQSTNGIIISKEDGTSEIRFDHSHLKNQPTPSIFPTQMMMLPQGDPTVEHDIDDPDCYCELCEPGPESRMIEKFAADGKPIYYFRDPVTGHCPWDEDCSCEACRELSFYEEMIGGHHQSYSPHKNKQRKSRKKSTHSQLYKRWMQGDPSVGPLGEDNGRFIYLVDYGSKSSKPELPQIPLLPTQSPSKQPPTPQKIRPENLVQPCYKKVQKWVKKNPQPEPTPQLHSDQITSVLMFQPTSSTYDKDFPPLEEFTEKEFKHAPKIPTPLHGERTSAAEATLNWQTENSIAQNTALQRIDSKVTQMGAKLNQIKVDGNTKIANELIVLLHKRLQQVEKQTTPPGLDLFYHLELKEKEIQTLKEQIRMLEETGQVPQPLEEEEFFQSLRRGPPPKPQPSIFASSHTEVTSPSQNFLFAARTAETKKPTTYEIYQQIKQQEAEKKR
ncbi:hypothetical protein V6N11_065288 [Hibiscus sabdariffa]|uniref:Uncharacterized protein n=1 Tax=Hibiscus sabdariffa TaxID=183260 RepID=A0ABR2QGH3_9ROSI